jgi:hypothetical protein
VPQKNFVPSAGPPQVQPTPTINHATQLTSEARI